MFIIFINYYSEHHRIICSRIGYMISFVCLSKNTWNYTFIEKMYMENHVDKPHSSNNISSILLNLFEYIYMSILFTMWFHHIFYMVFIAWFSAHRFFQYILGTRFLNLFVEKRIRKFGSYRKIANWLTIAWLSAKQLATFL